MNNETSNMNVEANFSQTLSGKYKIFVVDSNENIVYEQPDWQKNLILNQGMDAIASVDYSNLMYYGWNGTGTRENSILSGDSSGSVAAGVFTLVPGMSGLSSLTGSNSGYTNALQVGDMIKFNSSSAEVRVLAVSNLTASVTPSTSVSQEPFIIWKTSQVGMQTFVQRASNSDWFVGAQDGTYCGTTIVGNIQKNRRTWDFAYLTSSLTFTEVAVGWGTSQSQIFSRILLPVAQAIGVGQKLRLLYELDIAMYPTASSPGIPATASISGWPVAPSTDTGFFYNLQKCGVIPGWVSTISQTGALGDNRGCEPAANVGAWIGNSSASNANYDGITARNVGTYWSSPGAMGAAAYVPFSYTLTKTNTFDVATGNRNDIRSFGIGNTWRSTGGVCILDVYFSCVFNQPQTKLNTQTLSLTFVWNWARVLA